MEREPVAQVLDAVELLRRSAADHPVDLVALLEQQLRQVGAVLAGDPGDQRALCRQWAGHRMAHRLPDRRFPSCPASAIASCRCPRGVRVHLAEAGPEDAPPVLCLHGWPQHWLIWRRVIPLPERPVPAAVPRPARRRLERLARRRRLPQGPARRRRARPARPPRHRARARRRARLGRVDRAAARRPRARPAAGAARARRPASLAAAPADGAQRVAARLPGADRDAPGRASGCCAARSSSAA